MALIDYTPEQIAAHDSWLVGLTPAEHAELVATVYRPLPILSFEAWTDPAPDTTCNKGVLKSEICDPIPSPLPQQKDIPFAKERIDAVTRRDAKEKSKWNVLSCDRFYPRCDLKTCPRCQRRKAKKRIRRMNDAVTKDAETSDAPAYYHFILTLPENAKAPAQQIQQLVEAFAALRERVGWERHIQGGSRSVHPERNEHSKLWHCHLHVFAHANHTVPADAISKIEHLWLKLTGGILIPKTVDSDDYQTKAIPYVGASTYKSLFHSPEDLHEFIRETPRKHMFANFGNRRTTKKAA